LKEGRNILKAVIEDIEESNFKKRRTMLKEGRKEDIEGRNERRQDIEGREEGKKEGRY
jgi:hypothetical protein